MKVYIGCPIWSFKGWVGNFYPGGTKSGDFLREYARRLTTIEGNTTFYAVPAAKTIESWVEQTPEIFRFCPKIPKAISHEGKLADSIGRAQEFVNVMRPLGPRLGPMFLQLPPRYSPRLIEDLVQFLGDFPNDVRLGVEVRHLDWFDPPDRDSLNQMLISRNMARVVIDTRPIRDLAGDEIRRQHIRKPAGGARTETGCAGIFGSHRGFHVRPFHRPPGIGAEPSVRG
jgi:uncharacterized protein YecE (DUF72 family)